MNRSDRSLQGAIESVPRAIGCPVRRGGEHSPAFNPFAGGSVDCGDCGRFLCQRCGVALEPPALSHPTMVDGEHVGLCCACVRGSTHG